MKAHVIALHGIGNQRAGWSNQLEDGVRRVVGDMSDVDVVWSEVSYAGIAGLSTAELWHRVRARVSPTPLRRFVFSHLADAINLDAYQNRVFSLLERALLDAQDTERVILVSHSLGTVLAVRWLASLSHPVKGLVTLGSPLPLFLDPLPPTSVAMKWVNCYDPLDPIGCPLLPLGYTVH